LNPSLATFFARNSSFPSSWNDGTALCELAEVLKPGQLDPRNLNPNNRLQNATLGVTSAEKNMDIPAVLAPEDMVVDDPDELSVMTYISYFRDYVRINLLPTPNLISCASSQDRRMNAARDEEEKRRSMLPHQPLLLLLGFSNNLFCSIASVPDYCIAYGPGLEGGETYKEGVFTIEARNCFGERVSHGNDTFVVLIKSPKNHAVECHQVNNQNGTYSCSYTPDTAGVHTISITLHNKPIQKSPWRPNITKAGTIKYCTAALGFD